MFLRPLSTRNPAQHAELVAYLEKHQEEIIDDEPRQSIGKCIGSGRVGKRQKDDGMSWSKKGSHSLAHPKLAQLNGQWNQVFETQHIAA